jgi:serine/threonine protein kinase
MLTQRQKVLVKSLIGEGKNAQVFDVCYASKCNLVLKKVSFKKVQGKLPITIEQFKKEVRNQTKASEYSLAPNIIGYYISDEEGNIIMEKMDKTLSDCLLDPKISLKSKKYYLQDAVNTLKKLHGIGIAHGDVKLENFMISDEDDVMLIDFGYSNSIEDTSRLKSKFQDDIIEFMDAFNRHSPFFTFREYLQTII